MTIALDIETRLGPVKTIEALTQRFNALRNAHTDRFNPPLGATNAALIGAEGRLLREVSATLMFLLDEMVRSAPAEPTP